MDNNAWRQLFLMNELNELQTYRIISCELTLLVYALIMEGIGVTNWVNHDPNLTIHKEASPRNFALVFFVTTLVIYGIGVVQYLVKYMFQLCYPLETTEFVDLCSICNMSLLMFDESLHGYYIHGRSPFGQAEITQEQMRSNLYFESSGKAQMRGITDSAPDLQTFEIFVNYDLIQHYKAEYLQDVTLKITEAQTSNTQNYDRIQQTFSLDPSIPQNMDMEKLDVSRKVMNKLMINYVELVRSEPDRFIKERTAWDRLVNRSPHRKGDTRNYPIMYPDRWESFSNTFLQGMDWDFLMLYVCGLSFIEQVGRKDASLQSKLMLGVLVTYIVDCLLVAMRRYFGQRNIAKQTLTPEQFLI